MARSDQEPRPKIVMRYNPPSLREMRERAKKLKIANAKLEASQYLTQEELNQTIYIDPNEFKKLQVDIEGMFKDY
jgi:hypothetical protein